MLTKWQFVGNTTLSKDGGFTVIGVTSDTYKEADKEMRLIKKWCRANCAYSWGYSCGYTTLMGHQYEYPENKALMFVAFESDLDLMAYTLKTNLKCRNVPWPEKMLFNLWVTGNI